MKKIITLYVLIMLAGNMLAAPVNAEKAAVVARTFWSETLKAKNGSMMPSTSLRFLKAVG